MGEDNQRGGGRKSRESCRDRRTADASSTIDDKLTAVEAHADRPESERVPDKPGIIERARGALLGLAIGDALGATLEFGPRVASPIERREMVGGGPFGLEPGQFTDDTSQAVALAKSLVACQKFDGLDIMTRFVSWFRTGEYSSTRTCFDIGGTTRRALERFERTGNPFQGEPDERSSGNGSIMRLASVAIFTLDAPVEEAIRIAQAQSRLTHGSAVCLDGCSYLVQLLRLVLQGVEDPLVLALPRFEGHPDILRAKSALWGGLERRFIKSGGYVADTLEAALWACANAPSFERAVTLAVNLGFDSDTVGAVAGALAGAKFGDRDIPSRWLEPLAQRHRIGALALSLVRSSSAVYRGGL